jgi:hypothetical protein
MAKGIKVPTEVKDGRLVALDGDDYIEMLVSIAMGSGDSENPFQDLCLGEFMIYAINDGQPDGEIKQRVTGLFDSLEGDQLARLESQEDLKIVKGVGDEAASKFMELSYVNMETGERRDLRVPIPSGGE